MAMAWVGGELNTRLRTVIIQTDPGGRRPEFKSWLCCFLACDFGRYVSSFYASASSSARWGNNSSNLIRLLWELSEFNVTCLALCLACMESLLHTLAFTTISSDKCTLYLNLSFSRGWSFLITVIGMLSSFWFQKQVNYFLWGSL